MTKVCNIKPLILTSRSRCCTLFKCVVPKTMTITIIKTSCKVNNLHARVGAGGTKEQKGDKE